MAIHKGSHHNVSLRRPIIRPETLTPTADAAAKKRLKVWLKAVIWNPLLAGANKPTMKAMEATLVMEATLAMETILLDHQQQMYQLP